MPVGTTFFSRTSEAQSCVKSLSSMYHFQLEHKDEEEEWDLPAAGPPHTIRLLCVSVLGVQSGCHFCFLLGCPPSFSRQKSQSIAVAGSDFFFLPQ